MGKTKLRLSIIEQRVGGVSLMLLLLLLFVLFCPVSYQDAQAEETEPLSSTGHASIALAISEAPALNITPTASGQFDQTTAQVKVTTSSNNGYKLYLGTADATNAMYSTDNSKTAKINALAEPVATTDFLANTWGYALVSGSDNTNTLQYQAVPESATVVADSPQAAGEYELNFGVKLDTALPAGQYVNNVMISAIANPTTVTGLMSLTYMQDMTSNICQDTKAANGANTVTPGNEVEKRLIDVRDGKEYWVAKLADGNCWMTQNLALDLNEKTLPLKPETSDVKQAWSPRYATRSNAGKLVLNLTTEERAEYDNSWNLGSVVLATPSLGPLCNSAPTTDSTNNDGYNSVRPGFTIAQSCKNFQDVSSGWQPTYTAKIGLWEGKNAGYDNTDGFVTVDTANKTYDAHYLVGNYYQWGSATAGTGTADVVSTGAEQNPSKLVDATGSICPKGWRLPQGGQNTVTAQPFDLDDSAYRLLIAYGYPKTGSYQSNGGTYNIHGIAGTSGTETAYKDMTFSPLRYLSAGYVATWSNSLRDAGANGILWSSTAYVSSDSAYVLHPSRTYIYPSRGLNRHEGGNIRCLAR